MHVASINTTFRKEHLRCLVKQQTYDYLPHEDIG